MKSQSTSKLIAAILMAVLGISLVRLSIMSGAIRVRMWYLVVEKHNM